jgi:hypothetical protein
MNVNNKEKKKLIRSGTFGKKGSRGEQQEMSFFYYGPKISFLT